MKSHLLHIYVTASHSKYAPLCFIQSELKFVWLVALKMTNFDAVFKVTLSIFTVVLAEIGFQFIVGSFY